MMGHQIGGGVKKRSSNDRQQKREGGRWRKKRKKKNIILILTLKNNKYKFPHQQLKNYKINLSTPSLSNNNYKKKVSNQSYTKEN